MNATIKVRVSSRIATQMTGMQAYHDRDDDPEMHDLIKKVLESGSYADGSHKVELDRHERSLLRDVAEDLYDAARDDAGWDPYARGDVVAASALIKKLDALKETE